MDRTVIENRLESLRRCLARIRAKCPATAAALAQDPDAQDIVAINLTRAVQLCVDIGAHLVAATERPAPETMGQTFDLLAESGSISTDVATRMNKARYPTDRLTSLTREERAAGGLRGHPLVDFN